MKRQLRYFVMLMGLLVLAPGWTRAAEITAANSDTATWRGPADWEWL